VAVLKTEVEVALVACHADHLPLLTAAVRTFIIEDLPKKKENEKRKRKSMTITTMFTCTQYSGFCPYSENYNIPTKLFTWLGKMNIPLVFLFEHKNDQHKNAPMT